MITDYNLTKLIKESEKTVIAIRVFVEKLTEFIEKKVSDEDR
jgi:hypothetical protein